MLLKQSSAKRGAVIASKPAILINIKKCRIANLVGHDLASSLEPLSLRHSVASIIEPLV